MSEEKLDDETERLIRVLDKSFGGTVAADELRSRIRTLVSEAEVWAAQEERRKQMLCADSISGASQKGDRE